MVYWGTDGALSEAESPSHLRLVFVTPVISNLLNPLKGAKKKVSQCLMEWHQHLNDPFP